MPISLEQLKSIKFFKNFSREELSTLSPLLVEQRYHNGRTIYAAGEPSENLFIIASGSISITHELKEDIITLAQLSRGYFFGEAGILNEKQIHKSEARAAQEGTVIYKLNSGNFNRIKQEKPQLALRIMHAIAQTLSNRLGEDTTRIAIISAISDLVNKPAHLNNIENLADKILAITLRAIPCYRAFLGIYEKHEQSRLKILSSVGLSPKHLPKTLPIDSDPYLHKLYAVDGEVLMGKELYKDKEKVFYAKSNLLARAINVEDNNVGVIALADKENGEFTGQNSLMLQIIAGQISFALEEASMRTEKREKEELKREYVGM